ncbi:MAG: integration host factor subunit alpha [Alphaproteobacteria bacterium]|nr:integration host factor subunit alpha [Alphaproteobacteria bacterium]MBN2779912.1 integration host factor subunit alpha [Alphaproteobacteria bacterium]
MATLTRKDIARHVSDSVGLSVLDTDNFVKDIFDIIGQSLANGDDIKISDFGSFELRKKNPRVGRNPKTKEEVMISGRTVVSFRPSEKLKKDS